MSTTTRELRAVHFVDGLLGNARDARGASPVSPVELSELLLSPGAEARARSSPSKLRLDRQAVLDDLLHSIRTSFGANDPAQGEAAVDEFLLNLQVLDNQVTPEVDSFLEILREIHENPAVAKVFRATYDFSPSVSGLSPVSRAPPTASRSPAGPPLSHPGQTDSIADLGATLDALSHRLDASVADMVREGATVLGNNATTGNQRLAPQPALPYKRSLNFVTGQKQSASGSAGVTPTTTSRRSETAPSSRTVTAPPPTVQSRPPTVSSRPAPAINISRRVGGDQNPASLTADRNRERPRDREVATEREREREWDREREPERERERPVERDLGHRDADGTMLSSRSAMFGNLSTIGGPSENVSYAEPTPESHRYSSHSKPEESVTRTVVDSGYKTMSQIHGESSGTSLGAAASTSAEPSRLSLRPAPVITTAFSEPPTKSDETIKPASATRSLATEFTPATLEASPAISSARTRTAYEGGGGRRLPLGTLPLAEQERLVVDDLLFLLLDINGIYIRSFNKRMSIDDGERPETMAVRQLEKREGTWEMDSTMDTSLGSLVTMILPVSRYYHKLQVFVKTASSMEVGRISNAVAAAVRGLLKEYLLLVVQLETMQRQGALSLQKLFYHVNPTLRTMRSLQEIATAICNPPPIRRGCQLVSLLERRLIDRAGDPVSRALHTTLLRASLPSLLHQIREWIYKGLLRDDGLEFFVAQVHNQHNTVIMTSESWGDEIWNRFAVVDENVPPIFEEVKEKILDAGRNWDIMRTCKKKVGVSRAAIEEAVAGPPTVPGSQQLVQTLGISGIFNEIELAFTSANAALLDLLMKENDLMSRLRSMKRYFLLDSADFLVQFLDLASEELSKRASDVSQQKLQNLWDLSTGGKTDSFRVEISSKSFLDTVLRIIAKGRLENQQETSDAPRQKIIDPGVVIGFDGFVLGYLTTFPVSIILNYHTVLMYKTLFRHLFNCKHVERLLAAGWEDQSHRKWLKPRAGTTTAGSSVLSTPVPGTPRPPADGTAELARFENRMGVLRNQMLNALRHVMLYMSVDVIERRFKQMEFRIAAAKTVMQVLDIHVEFLSDCCKECMITEEAVIAAFSKVMYIIQTFCAFSSWVSAQMRMIETGPASILLSFQGTYALPDQLIEPGANGASKPTLPPEVLETLSRLYHGAMRDLIAAIRGATEGCPQLGRLAQRLDFDSWYTAKSDDPDKDEDVADLESPDTGVFEV